MNTSIINITLNNKTFQLSCKQEEESELHQLVTNLNHRIFKLKTANPSASFELLLVMVALSLQEEVTTLRAKNHVVTSPARPQDTSESSDTLSKIIASLESLANKLGK